MEAFKMLGVSDFRTKATRELRDATYDRHSIAFFTARRATAERRTVETRLSRLWSIRSGPLSVSRTAI